MDRFVMTIGGQPVESESRIPVIDPATGIPVAEAHECTPKQLDRARPGHSR